MNPIKKIINSFRGSQEESLKQSNNSLSNDFLKYGNRKANKILESDKKINPDNEILGWISSSLNIRANNFSMFCEENLITESEIKDTQLYHPYLKLIENSVKESEFDFWRSLISDLDIYGQAFIFLQRRVVYEDEKNEDGTFKLHHVGLPVSIESLDAKKMTVLRNHIGKIVGYREQVSSTLKREFYPDQIIYVINRHPRDRQRPYSVFEACSDYQYTINKGTEFAQNALLNNMNTPGILSTPEILNDEEYDNLMSRINSHTPGEVIVSDGTGQLHYESINQDIDKAALPSLNEISRQTIFAVMGVSKTILGIEESGTTRETAKVQDKKFINKVIAPLVHKFVSALNFDYMTHYPGDYERTKQKIEVKSLYDPAEALEQFTTQKALFDSINEIVYSGYTPESAEDFIYGNISYIDLEKDDSILDDSQNKDIGQEDTSETSPGAQEDASNIQDDNSTFETSQNDFDENTVKKWFSN